MSPFTNSMIYVTYLFMPCAVHVVTLGGWGRMTVVCGIAQRGGYTPAEQERRERLRVEAAGRFARGDRAGEIARDLRVTAGPVSRERLSPAHWARLEAELRRGPLRHP